MRNQILEDLMLKKKALKMPVVVSVVKTVIIKGHLMAFF